MAEHVRWGSEELQLDIAWDDEHAPQLSGLAAAGVDLVLPAGLPLIEPLTVADGHAPASSRLVYTALGGRARYRDHHEELITGPGGTEGRSLAVTVADPVTGLEATLRLFLAAGTTVLRSVVELVNSGRQPVAVRSVPSWAARLGLDAAGGTGPADLSGWRVHRAASDWLGEGRWSAEPADRFDVPDLTGRQDHQHSRGSTAVTSTGTWSTGTALPVAAIGNDALGITWAWQIEHNGGWRWEIGQDGSGGYLALSGPTDSDHQWLQVLQPGQTFTSVPVAVTLAPTFTDAIAALTRYRRAVRRPHPDNAARPIVFNDYMNALNGDPTTAKLLPLIDAASAVGAEVFCIDAGWYDDSGHWWDSVGEWQPSRSRFPGGLGEVLDRIRDRGMVPGLWLEPEVVGVASPMAEQLPDEAFLQRAGQRIVEHERYHLDLRHPAARAHLDAVVDRLVGEYGVGYFKLDYNINPGPGTDHDADSVGAGLLAHNRAHLGWLDAVLDRHPELILENCGSGAMRSDFAMLSRMQLQSTSDLQDFLLYPSIAAAAPAAMLPEQAAHWAYPQPEMTAEEAAICLVTGLLGRFFLSGHLNNMSSEQVAEVSGAVQLAVRLRPAISAAVPFWPLGLPRWDDPVVALGLAAGSEAYLSVWDRRADEAEVSLDLGPLTSAQLTGPAAPGWRATGELSVEQVFPTSLPAWPTVLDTDRLRLRLRTVAGTVGARIFRVSLAR